MDSAYRPVDWHAVRSRYPAALRKAYLDTACKGIPPPEAVTALEEYAAFVRECPGRSATDDTIVVVRHLELARERAAALIGADVDEIALVESTQQGLTVVAQLLELGAGDRVLASDMEFLGTVLPWWQLQVRGVELELVPNRCGRVDLDDFAEAIDERTRVVVVSSVQEANGSTVDLRALGELCRSRGVLLVVDAAQHVGPLPLRVHELEADAVAVGGHKWLCSPFGLGFLYVRRKLLDRYVPAMRGYMALEEPAAGWQAHLEDPRKRLSDGFRFVRAARALEPGGTGPYAAATALAACLGELLRLGPEAIAARVRELVTLLTSELLELGFELTSPTDPAEASGIVCFGAGSPDRDRRRVEELTGAGIAVSLRYNAGVGGIRVSPYFYNDERDLDMLLAVLKAGRR